MSVLASIVLFCKSLHYNNMQEREIVTHFRHMKLQVFKMKVSLVLAYYQYQLHCLACQITLIITTDIIFTALILHIHTT